MKKPFSLLKIRILAAANITVIIVSFFSGYLVNSGNTDNPAAITETPIAEASYDDEENALVSLFSGSSLTKISQNTKIIYEYLYEGDGLIDRAEEDSPTILLNMTRDEVETKFAGMDWAIISFTPDEVVLRKVMSGKSSQYYVVGEYDGFIAVFYESEDHGAYLREITNIPVGIFPAEEQERLRNGIRVTGDEALSKTLESYGS